MNWQCKNIAYDVNGNAEYIGFHIHKSPSDDDTHFIVRKLTWTDGSCTKIQKSEGSWTNRASLF